MATVGESDRAAPGGRRPWAGLVGSLPGGVARWYRRDPLGFVEWAAREHGPVFRLPDDGSLCVADPAEALRVLHDEEGHYDEVSDFFHVRGGRPEPRETQVAVGRAARAALWARVVRAVAGEVRARRARAGPDGPGDPLDAVLGSTPQDTPAARVAQVYLLPFRTSVAPVGHVVAWALLAAATHGVDLAAVPAGSAVRESLRLWPVAS
ncbi:hypothetical protein [Streptosporangium sp. V21-05]|uniref:hypothetical protein n=1 Tax=Streptosporangium sp. V21-05 TaxID=3446115 RepID=UPI003F52B5B8